MNKSTIYPLLLFIFSINICSKAQTIEKKYYKDQYQQKEVETEKANFVKTTIQFADTVTTEIKDLRSNETKSKIMFKGKEPVGRWFYKNSKDSTIYDYNFELAYTQEKCPDTSKFQIADFWTNSEVLNYKAPIISTGENSIFEFLAKNIRYPHPAKEAGIQGKTVLRFNLTAEGKIEDIHILKGSEITLDKEAVRVIRMLKFSKPALISNVPQRLCIMMPIKFSLR